MRGELAKRRLASVYLSDRDSVFDSAEAIDLLHWLRACADNPLTARQATLTAAFQADGQHRVQVTYIGQIGPDEQLLRLVAEQSGSDEILLRDRLALTSREAEVLLWIANGKPNRDIGEILGISPRTVNKHLEQVFTKLGVENRASAAALAIRTLAAKA